MMDTSGALRRPRPLREGTAPLSGAGCVGQHVDLYKGTVVATFNSPVHVKSSRFWAQHCTVPYVTCLIPVPGHSRIGGEV